MPNVLIIAGLDNTGNAGVCADLRVCYDLEVHPAVIITALTSQTSGGVEMIEPVNSDLIDNQLSNILREMNINSIKIGMIFNRSIMKSISSAIMKYRLKNVVLDPVIEATCGGYLIEKNIIDSLISELGWLVDAITPNIPEAERYTGIKIKNIEDMKKAALSLWHRIGGACVIKGGHLNGVKDRVFDVVCMDGDIRIFTSRRYRNIKVRGSGCMFSTAIACFLAKGYDVWNAIEEAVKYIRRIYRTRSNN